MCTYFLQGKDGLGVGSRTRMLRYYSKREESFIILFWNNNILHLIFLPYESLENRWFRIVTSRHSKSFNILINIAFHYPFLSKASSWHHWTFNFQRSVIVNLKETWQFMVNYSTFSLQACIFHKLLPCHVASSVLRNCAHFDKNHWKCWFMIY